ncbi:CaiB/BaiF CoA transferase family protein [Chloroflexota bacterium]
MAFGLEGIKVIETATVFAGPMAGRLLADWGADVIHIEHPLRGDVTRRQGIAWMGGKRIESDINYAAQNFNRNKRGMALDLSKEDGQEILYRLLKKADVLLSNYRPRELKKFKLEYETLSRLNPRLIQANLTGYGKTGPDKDFPGYEHTGLFPRSGILYALQAPGAPPPETPLSLGDNVTGLALALGIMTALYMRTETGVGQEVDVSLFQTGVFAFSYDIAGALVTRQDRRQVDRKDFTNAVYNYYETKDGRWLCLALSQQDLYWSRFCQAIDRKDLEHDPRFETFEPRTENHVALFYILEEVFLTKTLEEWRVCLTEAGLPWSPIQSLPEVIADPQTKANDFFASLDHPNHGLIEVVANPIKLSKAPATVRTPAPEFGQHTKEVLLEYGYTWEDIERLKQQSVIA